MTGGKCPMFFCGVTTIGLKIQQVIRDIDTGRTQAESDERDEGAQDNRRPCELVSGDQRNENQQILRPLVYANGLHNRPQRSLAVLEDVDEPGSPIHALDQSLWRIDEYSVVRSQPDRHIYTGVARVDKIGI